MEHFTTFASWAPAPASQDPGAAARAQLLDIGSTADAVKPGAYVCRIEGLYDQSGDLKRVLARIDIAEGPLAGAFANSGLGDGAPDTVPIWTSPTPGNARELQRDLECIAVSNPGTSVEQLKGFWRSDLHGFRGLLVGVIYGEREFKKRDGEVIRLLDGRFASVPDLRAGNYSIPGLRHLDGTYDAPTPGTPIVAEEEA